MGGEGAFHVVHAMNGKAVMVSCANPVLISSQ
jgi:hypothetical protein